MLSSIRDRVSQFNFPEPIKKILGMAREWQQEVSPHLVGIEISAAYIKMIKIDYSKKPFTVEAFAVESIPADLVVKGEIKDGVAISNLLKEIFQKYNIPVKTVAFAIPRSDTIIKNITMDKRLTAEEVESRAWIEANRLFPDLIGDVYLDFNVIGQSEQDPGQLDVILVACRKDNIKPSLEAIKQAGLSAKMVDINCYVLDRALSLLINAEQQKQAIALLNINIDNSVLIVSKADKLLYAHDQEFDGGRLIKLTTKYLQDNGITAESITPSLLDDINYNNILKETLTTHLRHTVHFFYSSRPNIGINKVIIAGDCASVPLLALFIQHEMGIDAEIANPKENLKLSSDISSEEFNKQIPALIECCGLAIGRLDL